MINDKFLVKISIVRTPVDRILEMVYLQKIKHLQYIRFSVPWGVDIMTTDITSPKARIIILAQGEKLYSKIQKVILFGHSLNLIITFDKGNCQSFTDVKDYLQIFHEYNPKEFFLVLLGFITDHEEVTISEGEELAQELSCDYFETNSIDKEQIHNIYQFIASKHLEKKGKEN